MLIEKDLSGAFHLISVVLANTVCKLFAMTTTLRHLSHLRSFSKSFTTNLEYGNSDPKKNALLMKTAKVK